MSHPCEEGDAQLKQKKKKKTTRFLNHRCKNIAEIDRKIKKCWVNVFNIFKTISPYSVADLCRKLIYLFLTRF